MTTACLLAKANEAGHRTVLVVATRGEHGDVVTGVLAEGEQLSLRRTAESYASAEVLGIDRVEFLGYIDSDMMGRPPNDDPWSFWRTDIDHAAGRLAAILAEEQPDVFTSYDHHGNYGHPDHIQVHRVGHRAAELAGLPVVWEATINRDHFKRLMDARAELLDEVDAASLEEQLRDDDGGPPPLDELGLSEDEVTHRVDGADVWQRKRAAMLVYRSQISDSHFTLAMPEDAFALGFGTEWFRAQRPGGGPADESSTSTGLAAELFTPLR